ncbi:MAG TPA: primosomal protein N' [Candidatus Saccharimonadales bacterium]|nr:primosomal protein N' [Candidatus Saccharimonadales bacterium]
MEFYLISPQARTHAREAELTYEGPAGLKVGSLVEIEVGKKTVAGVIMSRTDKPGFATKPIVRTLVDRPLPEPLVKLAVWLSDYYQAHRSIVWQTMLPSGLTKSSRAKHDARQPLKRQSSLANLTADQRQAIEVIENRPGQTSLIRGVTGSGKTAIYLETARRTVNAGRSVIVLVPEIALTSQLVAEFTPDFPDLIVTHSNITPAKRRALWLQLINTDKPQVVIGPRSALFSPLKDLGLIVIDECHEPSLSQDKAPRYSALRAAAVLCKSSGARLVLGSATPNIADYYLAQATDPAGLIDIDKPARAGAKPPDLELIDLTKRANFTRNPVLSNQLIEAIQSALEDKRQVILFHNRRGNASLTLCSNCGWSAACPRCFLPLTLHNDNFILRCHVCNYTEKVPTTCPTCRHADIIHKGIGTKRIEEEVNRLFKSARIARFDGDSQADQTLDKVYQSIYDGDIDIIIGTQVVAKGLDLPGLGLVGVIQADAGLNLPDFYAEERTFQLLTQVIGRVGRTETDSRVIVQTYQPDHPAVHLGLTQNYPDFYDYVVKKRLHDNFPPASFLLKLTCVYRTEAGAIRACRDLAGQLKRSLPVGCQLLGPAPAFYERQRDTYRWQIIVKAKKRADLLKLTEQVPAAKWQIDLDPTSLL